MRVGQEAHTTAGLETGVAFRRIDDSIAPTGLTDLGSPLPQD
jgi:uncharacterized protein (UPF0210 family)